MSLMTRLYRGETHFDVVAGRRRWWSRLKKFIVQIG